VNRARIDTIRQQCAGLQNIILVDANSTYVILRTRRSCRRNFWVVTQQGGGKGIQAEDRTRGAA
jgi:hypothetical protein